MSASRFTAAPTRRCLRRAISRVDGYGNARVHKFADGTLLRSWGEPGTDPGQFNIAHNICCDATAGLCRDRKNHRVQVFDGNGSTRRREQHAPPFGLFLEHGAERASTSADRRRHGGHYDMPNSGHGQHLHSQGEMLARLGERPAGREPGQFMSPQRACRRFARDIYRRRGVVHQLRNRYRTSAATGAAKSTECSSGALKSGDAMSGIRSPRADDRRFEAMRKATGPRSTRRSPTIHLRPLHRATRVEKEHMDNLRAGKPHYRGIAPRDRRARVTAASASSTACRRCT